MNEPATQAKFAYAGERFADIQMLRYEVPSFDRLSLRQKKLAFFLYQAALCGRDIIYDQNYRHNLVIRHLLEAIIRHYQGDRSTRPFQNILVYAKRVWFANGIHHHYSGKKFTPRFTYQEWRNVILSLAPDCLPLAAGEPIETLLSRLQPIMFDPKVDAKKVEKDPEKDPAYHSSVNFYRNVSEKEVRDYHKNQADPLNPNPPSYGLNSTLVNNGEGVEERVWRVGGLYDKAIAAMVMWLERARNVTDTEQQARAFEHLIRFYQTGELEEFDAYSVAWVKDTEGTIDVIHGFIEVYSDPLGYRATFEAVVSMVDVQATRRIQTIAEAANWFEAHSPTLPDHKRSSVEGVSGKVIDVIALGGDCSPAAPIGINLPNAEWIREQHGSKSVNLHNIVIAHHHTGGALAEAFSYSREEKRRLKEHGALCDDLHTDLHEVIGHASGKLMAGVGTPKETLKQYASTLEESRADLVALYFILDPYLLELGLVPSLEVGKAAYDDFIRNGLLVQLRRLAIGEQLEEDHMRNRQLIAAWVFERGKEQNVIERVFEDGKTYFVIRDYQALRELFGELLKEVQRIKSEGDFLAGKQLVEGYGVRVDELLHREVHERVVALDEASYKGFINPVLTPVMSGDDITDVTIHYPSDFTKQMLAYGESYALLSPEFDM